MSDHNQENSKGIPTIAKVIGGFIVMCVGVMGLGHTELKLPGLEINFGVAIAMAGVMIMLFPIIETYYTKPLGDAIYDRTKNLENTFSEAENLKAEMAKLKTDYEARLQETEAGARAKIQEEVKKAQDMRSQLMAEASAKADEMKKRAEADIQADRERMVSELRLQTVNLALNATSRILGENVDDARNRKLVEEFITTAEVPA